MKVIEELTTTGIRSQFSGSSLDSFKSGKLDLFNLSVERVDFDSNAYVISFSQLNSSGSQFFQSIPLSKSEISKFRLFLRMAYEAKINLVHNIAEFYEVSVSNNNHGGKIIILKIDQEIARLLATESQVNLELNQTQYLNMIRQLTIEICEKNSWEMAA